MFVEIQHSAQQKAVKGKIIPPKIKMWLKQFPRIFIAAPDSNTIERLLNVEKKRNWKGYFVDVNNLIKIIHLSGQMAGIILVRKTTFRDLVTMWSSTPDSKLVMVTLNIAKPLTIQHRLIFLHNCEKLFGVIKTANIFLHSSCWI